MSGDTSFQFLRTKKEEAAFIITIDNPPVNVLNLKLLQEIPAALKMAVDDPEVRGVVITGAGTNAFCAGADLKMMLGFNPDDAATMVQTGHRSFFAVENCPKPVIAAVNGLALGGGNELAMACDIRYVSDRARFGQPEVKLGLIPAWGGTQRMSRLIGTGKAKELIFSGQMINAQEALRIGLVNRSCPTARSSGPRRTLSACSHPAFPRWHSHRQNSRSTKGFKRVLYRKLWITK